MGSRRLSGFSLGVLGFNLLVILWGAYVRASGSGAGCGSHWPLCNGEVMPRAPALQTVVELSHRVSSGLALLCVVALWGWVFLALPKGHPARKASAFTTGFMLAEALIGAAIVLLRLVAHNESIARAFSTSAHLINTFLLVASLTLTCWFLRGGTAFRIRKQGGVGALLAVAWGGGLLTGVSGAVAALGDTLFPAQTLAEGLAKDGSPGAHLFIQLRILHPLLAVLLALVLLLVSAVVREARPAPRVRRIAQVLGGLVGVQLVAGFLNVALLAPLAMQLLHLLLANAVWITLVLLTAEAAVTPHTEKAPGVRVGVP